MSTSETKSQAQTPTIFILGASGYIGGNLLTHLLSEYPQSKIYVQYRKNEHKQTLQDFSDRIEPVKLTLDDDELLQKYASIADVVISAADCDHVASARSLIAGLESVAKQRTEDKKLKSVYIHTSGTGVLCDSSIPSGEQDDTMYDDSNLEQIEKIPADRPHREVDILVKEAFERGHFLGFIVLPSTIYGLGKGPIHTVSQQIPNLVNYALSHKSSAYIAPGKNIWSNVHIEPLTKLYISLISLLLSPSAPPPPRHGFSHYVFATSTAGPHSWKDLSIKVGDLLAASGEIPKGGAEAVDREKYKGPDMGYAAKEGALQLATSVGKSSNAEVLVGWEDKEVVWDWLEQDVRAAVKVWKEL